MKWIYVLLAIVGTALPMSQFGPWFAENGLNIPLFVTELFANPISRFFGLDVIISALVTLLFIVVEGRRSSVPSYWIPIAGTCLVGVSLGLPLFLAMREHRLSTNQQDPIS